MLSPCDTITPVAVLVTTPSPLIPMPPPLLRIDPALFTVPATGAENLPMTMAVLKPLEPLMVAPARLSTLPAAPSIQTPLESDSMSPAFVTVPPALKFTPSPKLEGPMVPLLVRFQAWVVAQMAAKLLQLTVKVVSLTVTPPPTSAVVPTKVSRTTPSLVLVVISTSAALTDADVPATTKTNAATAVAKPPTRPT